MKHTLHLPPEFTTVIEADDALAIALFGWEGSGKTRFCCTAPDPIGLVALDRKTRKTVEKHAKELGKTIVMPKEDFIRVAKPMELAMMNVDAAKKYYRSHVNKIKNTLYKLYENPAVRTIVLDTGTQLWEDMLFAEYGRSQRIMPRDRGPANQEMIDLLNALSGKNFIITHKAAAVWKNDKETNESKLSGFSHIGYHVNVIAEMAVDMKKEAGDEGRFSMTVVRCQANPDLQGPSGKDLLQDDMINFQALAMSIYPDSDMSDWE